jgi:hypothetical protein
MASFATLASTTAYLTLLTQINDRDIDLAKAFDPAYTTVTSQATNSVRYSSANKRWETYNGSAWVELIVAATDAFNMTVTGLRGGTIYGSVTNSGTITGGTINATALQVSGSAAWTAASLTNLNQLTNGPGYITASALSPYALLASPTLTGAPTAPTAAVDTSTTQLATTQYVVNQGYLKASSAAATYAAMTGTTFTGDVTTYRSGAPTTGVIYLGNGGSHYLYFDGTQYILNAAQVLINGSLALNTGNYNSYVPTLTGGGASGTWGISITGNSANASTLLQGGSSANADTFFTGTTSSGRQWVEAYASTNAPNTGWWMLENMRHSNGGNYWGVQYAHGWETNANELYRRNVASGIWGSWVRFLHSGNFNAYAPTLTGGGASGTWTINVTGNSTTTSQRTFSQVRTDGINRGGYGAISISGSNGGYSGIDFTDVAATFMIHSSISGVFRNNSAWDWYFTNGVLTAGTVPWANLSGQPILSVSITTSTATPTGGSNRDVVFQY